MEYKYEVGFSFLKQDEAIAYDLNDHIQDRLSTFIYSKRQEEMGGTDGEKKFNEIFHKQCRVVVVLYRDGWGQTPWTRIEETAIKNRAFDTGWEFLLIINLDTSSRLPTWIPKTYIWVDYPRFKTEGAIAVIDQKVKESGGLTRTETIEDRSERHKRQRKAEKERELFLKSDSASGAANQEVKKIMIRLREIKLIIEDPSSYFNLSTSEKPEPPMYQFGNNGFFLCFVSDYSDYNNDFENGLLKVTLYEKSGHHNIDYKERVHKQAVLKFDIDLLGNYGWSDKKTGKDFLTTDELLDKWAKLFMSELEKRRRKMGN